MPPSAAPEWLRTGWIFERSATSAPASWASIAARMPAQPAPTTRTSCFASTNEEAIGSGSGRARVRIGETELEEELLPRHPEVGHGLLGQLVQPLRVRVPAG